MHLIWKLSLSLSLSAEEVPGVEIHEHIRDARSLLQNLKETRDQQTESKRVLTRGCSSAGQWNSAISIAAESVHKIRGKRTVKKLIAPDGSECRWDQLFYR